MGRRQEGRDRGCWIEAFFDGFVQLRIVHGIGELPLSNSHVADVVERYAPGELAGVVAGRNVEHPVGRYRLHEQRGGALLADEPDEVRDL